MNRPNDKMAAVLALAAGLLCACATAPTRAQRIKANAQEFSSFPPDVQANIRAGRIETGYTPDMVLMAFGEPKRRYTETSERGVTEVWTYTEEAPRVGGMFSLGFGGGRGPFGYGIGISEAGSPHVLERTRVIFQNGLVIDVQQLKSQ